MSTYFQTVESARAARKWWLIDADGLTLGRLASHAADVLSGKNKPTWAPHSDVGDHVVIINCDKVVLTGRKAHGKIYRRHTGHPGGLKEIRAGKLLDEKPTRVVELAIRGMLPKNRLGRAMARKLNAYAGSAHPHAAQKPEPLDLGLPRATRESA